MLQCRLVLLQHTARAHRQHRLHRMVRCGEYQRQPRNLRPLMQPAIVVNNLWVHGLGPRFVDTRVYCIEYAADQERSPRHLCAGFSENGLNVIEGEIQNMVFTESKGNTGRRLYEALERYLLDSAMIVEPEGRECRLPFRIVVE